MGFPKTCLSSSTAELMRTFTWRLTHNLRLENEIKRETLLCGGESLDETDINEGQTVNTCGSSRLWHHAYVENIDNAKNNNESKTLFQLLIYCLIFTFDFYAYDKVKSNFQSQNQVRSEVIICVRT